MNKLFFYSCIFIAGIAASCNNTNDTAKSDATIPAEEKQMRELIAKYPDSLLLVENLVEYFRNNSNYSQAIAETEHALKRDSANERLWYMKATLYSENDDTLQAINAWEKTIHLDPKPEYIMSLGSLYALSKNPLALGMAAVLMGSPESRYQGLFIDGLYYTTVGEKAKAVEFFEQCIAIDYTNTLAYREKAIALYDMGKYVDALKVLELAVAVKRTYDEAYYWMGRCYEKLDQKDQAVKSYQLALQVDPNYIEAKDALGKLGVVQ